MAALTAKEYREKYRGFLGIHEDSTSAVAGFVKKMTQQIVTHPIKTADTTTSSDTLIEVIGCVNVASQLISARFVASESATVSASDYFTLTIKKYTAGASGNTATTTMATLVSTTAAYTPNRKLASHAFTLSATSANLDIASGDTLIVERTKTLLGALVPPGGKVILEIQ
jgi:hypothetical protein